MFEVLKDLRRAAHTRANLALCARQGISLDDVVSTVILRSLNTGHGITVVTDPVTRRRYAAVAIRSAIFDEARKVRRRNSLPIDEGMAIVDPRPSPLDMLLSKGEQDVRLPRGRALAMALEFPTIAQAVAGTHYAQQARKRGVAPSTVTRQAKKAIKKIRDFFLGAQLSLPLDEVLSGVTRDARD